MEHLKPSELYEATKWVGHWKVSFLHKVKWNSVHPHGGHAGKGFVSCRVPESARWALLCCEDVLSFSCLYLKAHRGKPTRKAQKKTNQTDFCVPSEIL